MFLQRVHRPAEYSVSAFPPPAPRLNSWDRTEGQVEESWHPLRVGRGSTNLLPGVRAGHTTRPSQSLRVGGPQGPGCRRVHGAGRPSTPHAQMPYLDRPG